MLGTTRRRKWKWVAELSHSFRYLVDDLIRGRKFWGWAAGGVVSLIVAALAVSSNTSRLLVELTVYEPTYATKNHPVMEPASLAEMINYVLHEKIAQQLNEVFPLPTPAAAGNNKKSARGDAKPGFDEGTEERPTPTPNAVSGKKESGTAVTQTRESRADAAWWDWPSTMANQGEKGAPGSLNEVAGDGVFVKIAAKIKVTNVGSLSSTIQGVGMYIVEEVDGRRETWESQVEDDLEIKVSQGQSVEIGGGRGKSIIFQSGMLFFDYASIKLLGERLATLKLKERSRYDYAIPFLQLIADDAEERDRLLRIANPQVRSRLLLVVEVWDV
jgi:hypothetical protein